MRRRQKLLRDYAKIVSVADLTVRADGASCKILVSTEHRGPFLNSRLRNPGRAEGNAPAYQERQAISSTPPGRARAPRPSSGRLEGVLRFNVRRARSYRSVAAIFQSFLKSPWQSPVQCSFQEYGIGCAPSDGFAAPTTRHMVSIRRWSFPRDTPRKCNGESFLISIRSSAFFVTKTCGS